MVINNTNYWINLTTLEPTQSTSYTISTNIIHIPPTEYASSSTSGFAIFGYILIAFIITALLITLIDACCVWNGADNENRNNKQCIRGLISSYGRVFYLFGTISAVLLLIYAIYSHVRYENDLCEIDPLASCDGTCTRSCSGGRCSNSKYDCTKYGKDCSKECSALLYTVFYGYALAVLALFCVVYLHMFRKREGETFNESGLYERCLTRGDTNWYKKRIEMVSGTASTK